MSSEIQKTPYGALPSSLSKGRLADLCLGDGVQTGPFGSQLHQEDYVSAGTPIITVEHLGDNRILHKDLPCVSDEDRQRLDKYSLKSGDIVFSRVGSVDRRAIVREPEDGWLFSGRCLRVRPDPEKLDSLWLSYFFGLPAFKKYIRGIAVGATMPSINTKILSDIPIYFPHLDAQRNAAKCLVSIDNKIEINRRINQTQEAVAQAIFKSWFVDFDPVKAKIAAIQEGRDPLRAAMSAISGKAEAELDTLPREAFEQLAATAALFPDEMEESDSGPIPKGWNYKTLAQLTDKIGSGSTPRGGKEVYLEEGVALIRSQNVYDSLFVWEGLARISDEAATQLKGVTVQEDDVLLNITGASILRTCVVEPAALPARVNQHVAIIRAKAGVPPRFIHMHLLRPDIKSYLLGLNAGASREAITQAHIEALMLLTPGPELLAVFQTATAPLFQQVQRFAQQMRVLGELRDTLLPKLLSGELAIIEALALSQTAGNE